MNHFSVAQPFGASDLTGEIFARNITAGAVFDVTNIDAVIRLGVTFGLIRVDLARQAPVVHIEGTPAYKELLSQIAELLGRLERSLVLRCMMYDHAELSDKALARQIVDLRRRQPTPSATEQLDALNQLLRAQAALSDDQTTSSGPNVIVDCDTGTEGELGCAPGHIKIYQTIYAASYGENNWKDVYVESLKGQTRIVIAPAAGGKCNVGIGNPYRAVGWYFNYENQGSRTALIRMWEIPGSLFLEMLAHCGTEWQISQARQKPTPSPRGRLKASQFFVESCDHKARNQFGLWTHASDGTPTDFGAYLMEKSCNLVTYYDPAGQHEVSKRDGECRDIARLLEHLDIPSGKTRSSDLGTALSDARGNLTMNAQTRTRDQELLRVLEILRKPPKKAREHIKHFSKEQVRTFCNVLTYNDLSPQRLNTKGIYTSTGLIVSHLRRETAFLLAVMHSRKWHGTLRMLLKNLRLPATDLPDEIKTALPVFPGFSRAKTYADVMQAIEAAFASGLALFTVNNVLVDGLNVILRPLCSGNVNLGTEFQSMKGKREAFQFPLLNDKDFEVGISHRTVAAPLGRATDSLDGHQTAGFVSNDEFPAPLDEGLASSNTTVQLHHHSPVVQALHDRGIPIMGGISGTTRDIFRYFTEMRALDYWNLFSVVAAFMIKYRYHSLIECFAAAQQFYKRDQKPFLFRNQSDVDSLYSHIRLFTGIRF